MAAVPVEHSPRQARRGHEPVAPQRIAVFRALQLGGMLCSVPVLRALRRAYPHATITLIGLPSSEAFARRFATYVDDWIDFPGAVELPEQPPRAGELPTFFARARARRFDLALQLHGSGERTNGIVRLLGAKRTCGFRPESGDGSGCDDFIGWPEEATEIERLLRLVDHLGIERQGRGLEFPIDPAERSAWQRLAQHHALDPRRLVLVHPGARLPSRRWPVVRYAELADRLVAHGWQVGITGSADEAGIVASMRQAMRSAAVDLSGQTGLGVLGAAIESSRLFVCNDAGVSQVAVGVGTRCVVVSSDSEVDVERVFELATHQLAMLPRHVPALARPALGMHRRVAGPGASAAA